ncbi:helicase-exonuclease AddAB subunit AddA [Ruminiclostridium cellulolyticum]|uniref:ATP-dependent helicase/nuclease subunit A n=1 Tax=Ruminiclostridium cellulolyticum (strain ATCC 35319 / DSM 5812 / JCM 6584 / H10) TaxID=394503 RepID=ADDA_RUMCH|nr:helicase-exonuclease AddAB subunit AddA [Ruminiclostridium cellulolyticum]B8I2Y2.1 RecName: Full=ATP-dependent helicase/nuclease subunit A; AltName: Full=ATP-dependent helicase/nuclease AddA; AltName: Full=DNA 3'-5' helicase AddA [Ruminiclostridium cellulolyticum H10]ACL76125.1 recombination helicase AddA [Ruminiclostridium cellulolyticum H10]
MSETKWTKEQYAAITQKDCNLLVAAAAGAGKTAVLVERIIRKITDKENPVDIDSLLVVTFTNAAATEMRERIGAAISDTIEKNQGSKNISRQLILLNKASITTIHSFCLEVIRSNFQSIEIDPGFKILDETEATLLKSETLSDLFEEIYEDAEENEDFFELLESYGGNRDDLKIQDMVMSIYSFVQSYPWPEKWLEQQIESYNFEVGNDFGETTWGRILLETSLMRLEGLRDIMNEACAKIKNAQGLEKYLSVFIEDNDNLEKLIGICKTGMNWDQLYNYVNSFEFRNLPRCGKDAEKSVQESVKKIRDELKSVINGLRDEVFFMESDEIASDLKTMYPILKCVSRLVMDFGRRYAHKKSQRASVDFNDLEHFCLNILAETDKDGNIRPTKIAQNYKDKFTEILVDEYQDSNLVQEIIINMISKKDIGSPNVFMVGDVKQSIYRFRQAKPELFLEKYNNYSIDEDSSYRKILLFKNFRSRKDVVDGINYIFKQIMSQKVGELDYNEIEELNPGAGFSPCQNEETVVGGAIELHLIETSVGDNTVLSEGSEPMDEQDFPEEDEILDNIQKEARMVANRIIELFQADKDGKKYAVYDKKLGEYRNVRFSDIVILLRTTRNWTEVFSAELANADIPVFADTGSGFFKTPEVQVVLSLLQIIDNPYQDIPLLAVLRSPIVNFSTADLTDVRLMNRNASIFEALKETAVHDTQVSKKASDFLQKLEKWRDMSLYMSTHELIWQLYNETGYFSIVGAMQDGERKQANLKILFERALQYENTSYSGLFNFISFIDKLKTNKGDMGSAKVLGENDNVVRLMSIHKSKGLEFPVVFLCGCGKKFNMQDMYKSILLHQELGFGPDFVDYKKRIKYPSIPKQAIAQKIRIETLSEEMRILYVAMTRAREKLIITGSVNNIEKSALKWLGTAQSNDNKFPPHNMLKAQNYLDWICPSVMRHKDSVILRNAAGLGVDYSGPTISDDSSWTIILADQSDIAVAKRFETDTQDREDITKWLQEKGSADSGDSHEIHRRLDWKYTYRDFAQIPSKISVTELKRYFHLNNDEDNSQLQYKTATIKKPAFLEGKKGLSPAEKGTAMHFVMQHLDFHNEDIAGQVKIMVKKELLTEIQAKSIDIMKISAFINSVIGKRMLKSVKVYREVPFNIELPYKEIYPQLPDVSDYEDKILLQGVVDCYFEEEDHIVLIDYKTDYIPYGDKQSVKEKYRLQISYYSRALEMLTLKRVKERYIYLFSTGEIVEM